MKEIPFILFFLFTGDALFAQQKDSSSCPVINIEGPRGNQVGAGAEAIFSIKPLKKAYRKTHTISYKWFTNNGIIVGRQNESSFRVNTKGLEGQQLMVSVVVGGLESNCPFTSTITIDVVKAAVRTESKIIARPAVGH